MKYYRLETETNRVRLRWAMTYDRLETETNRVRLGWAMQYDRLETETNQARMRWAMTYERLLIYGSSLHGNVSYFCACQMANLKWTTFGSYLHC